MNMKFVAALLVIFISTMLVGITTAQETNTFSYNRFSAEIDSLLAQNINISTYPGDPVEYGPGFSDAPHTAITLYNVLPGPEGQWDIVGGIKVYTMETLATYPFLQAQADALHVLLADRPDLSAYMAVQENVTANALPYVPVLPHGQIIRAKAEYVDTGLVQGIRYLTVNKADASPFLSDEFSYTFQGISADGKYYVAVTMRLMTSVFPAEIGADFNMESFLNRLQAYLAESVEKLNAAGADAFQPPLDTLDRMIGSFRFG